MQGVKNYVPLCIFYNIKKGATGDVILNCEDNDIGK